MLLKCVGGPNDDEHHQIDNRYHIHDIVQIHQRPKFSIVSDIPHPDDIPEATVAKVEYYKIECFRNRNEKKELGYDELLFLVHKPMTVMQAMEHQFKKNTLLTDRAKKTIKALIYRYSNVSLEDIYELQKCLKIEDDENE